MIEKGRVYSHIANIYSCTVGRSKKSTQDKEKRRERTEGGKEMKEI